MANIFHENLNGTGYSRQIKTTRLNITTVITSNTGQVLEGRPESGVVVFERLAMD